MSFFKKFKKQGMEQIRNSKYSHDNFMTEKEKNYVEQINKKLILKAPNYQIMELCFSKSESEPFIVTKRDKQFSFSEAEKSLNSLSLTKSRKIPRDVNLDSLEFCSSSIALEVEVEEILDLIVKLKYNYMQILPNEEEYSPVNSISDQKEETFLLFLEKLKNNCEKFFNNSKFMNNFTLFFSKLGAQHRKRIFELFLQKEYFESELFLEFLRKNFQEIPEFNETELVNFKFIFCKTNVTIVLLTLLILKATNLSNIFIGEIKKRGLEELFENKKPKYVWQCLAIISSFSQKFMKKEFYEFLKVKVVESVDANDMDVEIYLKSIGKSTKDYK